MRSQKKSLTLLAVGYAIGGLACLVALFFTHEFPPLAVWAPFAVVFTVLAFWSVNVNDHLTISPTVMIALVAAVAFGRGSAAFGMAAVAALGPLTMTDIRERRLAVPVMNFGQMVITATAAGLVFERFLPPAEWTLRADEIGLVVLGGAISAIVYNAINLALVAFAVRFVYDGRDVLPWSNMGEIFPTLVVMGILGGLLGVLYQRAPVALPLIFLMFLIGYASLASYGRLREAQESTIRGFVKALEAKDLYTRGHTERVAYFTRIIAEELGYNGTQIEQLRWAALIHDVGKLAVPRELITKNSRLTDDEYEVLQRHAHLVEDLLAEVDFLRPMVEIASGHHAYYNGDGYGGAGHTHGERPSQEAMILAAADAFDAMTSTRSYRMALTQEYAVRELRANAGTQFDPTVVEALERALARRGERYGSPDVDDDLRARLMAESRGIKGSAR